jgi:hypothetical protein
MTFGKLLRLQLNRRSGMAIGSWTEAPKRQNKSLMPGAINAPDSLRSGALVSALA